MVVGFQIVFRCVHFWPVAINGSKLNWKENFYTRSSHLFVNFHPFFYTFCSYNNKNNISKNQNPRMLYIKRVDLVWGVFRLFLWSSILFPSTSFIGLNGAVNRMQFRIKERKKRREKQRKKKKKFHSEENYLYLTVAGSVVVCVRVRGAKSILGVSKAITLIN